jgi:hypothetical protein
LLAALFLIAAGLRVSSAARKERPKNR